VKVQFYFIIWSFVYASFDFCLPALWCAHIFSVYALLSLHLHFSIYILVRAFT
jgi:hypothetical protein